MSVQNPAFSNQHIRELTDIFLNKSLELRDVWLSQISDAPSQDGSVHLNVLRWLSRTTLDIIGLAGFDYNFNATNPDAKKDAMSAAFQTAFQSGQAFTWFTLLQNRFPILRMIVSDVTSSSMHTLKLSSSRLLAKLRSRPRRRQ